MSKEIYDPSLTWIFKDNNGNLLASYSPNHNLDENELNVELNKMPSTRVIYISRFSTINRTPRLTWSYGRLTEKIPAEKLSLEQKKIINEKYCLDPAVNYKSFPFEIVYGNPEKEEIVSYRALDFKTEVMPFWLQKLSLYCRAVCILNFNFDPEYNSVIVGRYDESDDSIAFHTDAETFLTHTFCANVTLGIPRDFQFKDSSGRIHEIKLGHKSLFFFTGLEHALPKRASVQKGAIRYSISFRNMANNIGIGNILYYCRGLEGAVDNGTKQNYLQRMRDICSE